MTMFHVGVLPGTVEETWQASGPDWTEPCCAEEYTADPDRNKRQVRPGEETTCRSRTQV